MPTKNPRINVVVERPLHSAIGRLARRDGATLSTKARDLLREAVELEEDIALGQLADERARSFDRRTALTHEQVWGAAPKKRR